MNDDIKEVKKTANQFDLDPERLSTTDEQGHRVYLYPEDVKGVWKDRRTLVYWLLIGVYLILPWIYINGKPSVQIDIFHREFTLMGFTWHGVEPIFIFLTLVSIIFFIAFMTSLLGRVWCGWGCPQTVFIQALFLKVEKFVEGSAHKRRIRDQGPMTVEKFFRKLIKWLIYFLIASHIAHTFIGYVWGPRELLRMTMHSPTENFGVFTAVSILTTIMLIDFGWFREQFCIIACPYGRMQSVLMDNNSIIVAYDAKRGEPRRGGTEPEGDCVNCYNCVKACPTGIDIRRGTQLECIACTNCIDACDEVMDKLHKPRGLVKYTSENQLRGGTRKLVTPRSILYVCISMMFLTTLGIFISRSGDLNFQFYRGIEAPFQMVTNADGSRTIVNHFTLKVTHQGDKVHLVTFNIVDEKIKSKIQIVTVMNPLKFDKPEMKTPIFFRFDPSILEKGNLTLKMEAVEEGKVVKTVEAPLVGPIN